MAKSIAIYKGWLDKSRPEYTRCANGTSNGKEWKKVTFKLSIPTGKDPQGKNTYMSKFITAWGGQATLIEQLPDGKSLEVVVSEREDFWEKDGERKYKSVYEVVEIEFPLPDRREAGSLQSADGKVETDSVAENVPEEEIPFD